MVTNFALSFSAGCVGWDLALNCISSCELSYLNMSGLDKSFHLLKQTTFSLTAVIAMLLIGKDSF